MTKISKSTAQPIILSKSVKKYDILLGRGKKRFKHQGNIAYRAFIESRINFYFKGDRKAKSGVVLEIIESIKSSGGRFLKNFGADWQESGLRVAREKVGHSIRDHCRSNVVFDFQGDMKKIFDETASFDAVLAYVENNYKSIVKQISVGDSTTTSKAPRTKKKQQQQEFVFPDESGLEDDAALVIVEDDDDGLSSISSGESRADESDEEMAMKDVRQIPERREPHLVRGTRLRSSAQRASFVNDFLFRLNEETERLAQHESLKSQRDNADTFRLLSVALIRDWIDVETYSEPSDDEWSEHLVSLAS